MAQNDSHPADELIESLKGILNGDNARQTLRDAWDRITGSTPQQPAQNERDNYVQNLNKQMNDQAVQDATKSYLNSQQAAKIRAKAGNGR